QAGFAAALEAAREFRGEAALSTWLHRIVYNAAIDQLRRRGREAQLPEDPDSLSDDDARLARAPSWARPERPLATAALQRAVFEMHEEEGRATEQVAEALNLTPGAVRVHLHRARLRLRARLAETLGRRS